MERAICIYVPLHIPTLGICAVGCGSCFHPFVAAHSLAYTSLGEDIGAIFLLNDDAHAVHWLYFWFTLFPFLDVIASELAECCVVPYRLDDLALGILLETFQCLVFLYFADFSVDAVGFFGVVLLFQVVMVAFKTCTKTPEKLEGGILDRISQRRIPLYIMSKFATIQFFLKLANVDLNQRWQVSLAIIPGLTGMALARNSPEETHRESIRALHLSMWILGVQIFYCILVDYLTNLGEKPNDESLGIYRFQGPPQALVAAFLLYFACSFFPCGFLAKCMVGPCVSRHADPYTVTVTELI